MRVLLLLLIISACTGLPRHEPVSVPLPLPTPEPVQPEPPKKKPERGTTIITINPPAKQQRMCVPVAADEKKRILQVLDCLIEEKAAK
jgi:hypothetical protein